MGYRRRMEWTRARALTLWAVTQLKTSLLAGGTEVNRGGFAVVPPGGGPSPGAGAGPVGPVFPWSVRPVGPVRPWSVCAFPRVGSGPFFFRVVFFGAPGL